MCTLVNVTIDQLLSDPHVKAFWDIFFILILATAIILIIVVWLWVLGLLGNKLEFKPFINATKDDSFDDMVKAIPNMFVHEICNIYKINKLNTYSKSVPGASIIKCYPEKLNKMNLSSEDLSNSISNLGTISISNNSLSIGNFVICLRRLIPLSRPVATISGILQKSGPQLSLIVGIEDKKPKSWLINQEWYGDDALQRLIRNASYQIIKDMSPKCSAKTWEGFMKYIEALEAYYSYTIYKNKKDLEICREKCDNANKIENGYLLTANLFYNIGLEYWKDDWDRAKEMFSQAIEIKKKFDQLDSDFSKILVDLGVSTQEKGDLDKAIEYYKEAKEANNDPNYFPPLLNLGRAYIKKYKEMNNVDDLDKAKDYFKEVFDKNSKNLTALIGLISVARELKKDKKFYEIKTDIVLVQNKKKLTLEDISKLIEKDLSKGLSMWNKASYYALCDNAEKTIEILNAYFDSNPRYKSKKSIENDSDFTFLLKNSIFIEYYKKLPDSSPSAPCQL